MQLPGLRLKKQFVYPGVSSSFRFMPSTARALILSRPAVIATVVIAFGLIVASVTLAAISTHEIGIADRRAATAQQTLVIVNQLLATINEAETAQRGYLLTHDEKYLGPYEAARPRYHDELAALGRQFANDPLRGSVLKRLTALCDQRFAEIAHTVQLRRDHGIAPALNVVESDEGWRLMSEIRDLLQMLQRHEIAAIASHTASAAERSRLFQGMNGALLALAAMLGGTVAFLLIRRLHDLEGLIKVCAWTKRVQWEGQWVTFEEYLARRFNLHCTHGMSEEAAERLTIELAHTPVPPEPPLR
jgi:CHASE3 domain sensor protein